MGSLVGEALSTEAWQPRATGPVTASCSGQGLLGCVSFELVSRSPYVPMAIRMGTGLEVPLRVRWAGVSPKTEGSMI